MRIFALALVLFLGGCDLMRPAVEIRTYLLQPSSEGAALPYRVGELRVQPPYEGKPLVYRFDEVRFEADYYNEFLATPRAMLERHFRARFTGNAQSPALTIEVTGLYGDFRTASKPTALFAMRASSTDWQREYTVSVPIADRSAQAVVQGLSAALSEATTRLEKDLSATTAPAAANVSGAPPESRR